MRVHRRLRWVLLLGLAAGACIPDVANDDPGVCLPGKKQCSGNAVQVCDERYHWKDQETCAGACSAGACVAAGACTPSQVECVGNAVRTCGADRQWSPSAPCPAEMPFFAGGRCTIPPSFATCTGSARVPPTSV